MYCLAVLGTQRSWRCARGLATLKSGPTTRDTLDPGWSLCEAGKSSPVFRNGVLLGLMNGSDKKALDLDLGASAGLGHGLHHLKPGTWESRYGYTFQMKVCMPASQSSRKDSVCWSS